MRGISIALCTRVGWPQRSSESCSASAFITVPSIPMWSLWVASIPDIAPVRPRQKLPPPTTTVTSTPSSRTLMISSAVWSERRSVETGAGLAGERLTRWLEDDPLPPSAWRSWAGASADLDLREADDLGAADAPASRLLVVLGVRLVEQCDVLEEAVEAALDDLGQCRLGLALVAADRLERLALLLDDVGRERRRG